MAGTFPISMAGAQVDITRETLYQTQIDVSESGIEVRTSWNNSARYRFKVSVIGRSSASEHTELATFVASQRGEWDTFTLVDPLDGTSRTCRFEGAPSFRQERIPGWWRMDCSILSLV